MCIAPTLRAIAQRQAADSPTRMRLVHTGRHDDARMAGDFFTQLRIPRPEVKLEVSSGTQAERAADVMTKYECLVLDAHGDLCLVTDSTTNWQFTTYDPIGADPTAPNPAPRPAALDNRTWLLPSCPLPCPRSATKRSPRWSTR